MGRLKVRRREKGGEGMEREKGGRRDEGGRGTGKGCVSQDGIFKFP
jgi:hypothetical protein